MNPSSQQHTTRITTKKITNLFHSCSMQRRRSEFSQGVFCCFFPPGFCLPHNLPPRQPQSFPEPVQEPRNWLQVPHSHMSKGQIIQLEKMVARPHPPRLQHLRRSGARRKRTQANQIPTRAQTSRLTRALDQRSVVRLDARSFAWSLAPSLDVRLFARRELTKVSPPPLPTGLRKRFHVVCPHTLNLIPELDPLDPP